MSSYPDLPVLRKSCARTRCANRVRRHGGPVLWHIRISHYNEKARWALEYKRVAHIRRAPLPGLHPLVALGVSGAPTLPILEIDGQTYSDSTRIIAEIERRWPEPALYPADAADRARALALEDEFDEDLGPQIRRLIFQLLFSDPPLAGKTLTGPNDERRAQFLSSSFAFAKPFVSRLLRRQRGPRRRARARRSSTRSTASRRRSGRAATSSATRSRSPT